jgi:O-antigen/teichoic acid export membrane protein
MKFDLYFGLEKLGDRSLDLVKGTAGSLAVKVSSIAIGVITSMTLARMLGAGGFGVYAYALAMVSLLGVPALLGLPQLLVRNIAAYQTQSAWGLTRGLLRRANQAVLLASIGLLFLTAVIGRSLARHFEPETEVTLYLSLVILPLAALTATRQAALWGFRHVVAGQVPDLLLRPLFFLALVAAANLFVDKGFSPAWAMSMQVIASATALFVAGGLLTRKLPQVVCEARATYKTRSWAYSALPLLVISGLHVVNSHADILILGALKGPEAAGVYRVAARGAELVVLVLAAVNVTLQPTIAGLYASRDMARLQRVITASARGVLLFSLPVGLVLILFGERLLPIFFGQEFTRGATALSILSAGQLVNAAMGSVGVLLNMTGHERDTAMGVGIAAVANIALNALLIPPLGIAGAAAATTASLIIWNILLAVRAYQRTGIHTTALGRLQLWKRQ